MVEQVEELDDEIEPPGPACDVRGEAAGAADTVS